jgi:hypothetical protein
MADGGPLEPPPPGTSVRAELDGFIAGRAWPEGDARWVLAACAGLLADQIDAGAASVALIRELHSVLDALDNGIGRDANMLDEVRAHRHVRRIRYLLPVS